MAAIGIDLGTTNSAAAYSRPGARDPKIQPTRAGENLTPSVVSLRRSRQSPTEGEVLVGRAALNNATAAPEETVFSIKRLMGHTYDEPKVAEVREKFSYTIERAPGDDPGLLIRLGKEAYTPVQISALILRQIKEDAEKALGEEVTHAVITVPAYFGERQRAATREAGELAGLVVKKIIDEPTAAAIAFGVQAPDDRYRILVYDLGGGTFDISILQMVKDTEGRDQVQVLEIQGDNWLGGDDFDRQIVDRILARVKEEQGHDLAQHKGFLALARKYAEEAKRALGAAESTDIIIPAAARMPDGATVDVDMPLGRAEFEEMIRGYVTRTMELVQTALDEQELKAEDITDVLLVGGSTLTPMVFDTVEDFFGKGKVKRTLNPMECVALGAGVLAATLTGVECPQCQTVNDEATENCTQCGKSLAAARSVGDTGVTEVTAKSLGVAAVKGEQRNVFVPIIPKGTPYPLIEPMKQTFHPNSPKLIRVPVYEGDDPVASRNEEQGVVECSLPQEIDLTDQVEVSFNYDRNRQLDVTVRVSKINFTETKTLRRDRPRTAQPAQEAQESEGFWQEELEQLIEFIQGHFLAHYGEYLDINQRLRIDNDLKTAGQLLYYPDEPEGRRMMRLLQLHIFNSGLASQLYLAVRMTDGVEPRVAQQISEAVNEIRQAHKDGNQQRVQQINGRLRPLVAQAMARKAGVQELADREDFGGLLRQLGS